MKHYMVYLLNYKESDSIILKDSYREKEDALKSLERNAIEYIKELQGKQQADICKPEKSIEDILADPKLKEGLYIKRDGDAVILYEKRTVTKEGRVWNSSSLKMVKVGKFYITEYNFDESMFRCNCSTKQSSVPKTVRPQGNWSFLDELKGLGGKFNLKPAKTRVNGTIETKTSFNDLCAVVDNF